MNKNFVTHGLIQNIFGYRRGRMQDAGSGEGPHTVILQRWGYEDDEAPGVDEPKAWHDLTELVDEEEEPVKVTVEAYFGLPMDEPFESSVIVWLVYVHKQHFIIAIEC